MMKMTTLITPLLVNSVLGVLGYSLLGGSVLIWILISWFGLVPTIVLYVFLSTKTELTADNK